MSTAAWLAAVSINLSRINNKTDLPLSGQKHPSGKVRAPMRKPLIASVIVHILVLLLVIVGIPGSRRVEDMPEQLITVELAPVVTKKSQAPAPRAPQPAKPEPVKSTPTPPPPPQSRPEPTPVPEPEPEPVKPAPQPEPAPEPKPEPAPEPVQAPPSKPAPKPQPTPAPESPPKPAPKPAPPKPAAAKSVTPPQQPQSRNDFASSILQTLSQTKLTTPSDVPDAKPGVASGGDLSEVLTQGEFDLLRRQIGQCWNFPAGAPNPERLIVRVRVTVAMDRTVQGVEVLNTDRSLDADPFYRVAKEAARRAVLSSQCNPLKLPPAKYQLWKSFVLEFDPRFMLGM
jgi:outer membrane biosynthesis protein TonB